MLEYYKILEMFSYIRNLFSKTVEKSTEQCTDIVVYKPYDVNGYTLINIESDIEQTNLKKQAVKKIIKCYRAYTANKVGQQKLKLKPKITEHTQIKTIVLNKTANLVAKKSKKRKRRYKLRQRRKKINYKM